MRMKSVRGFDSQAIVRNPADQPRSYIVSRDGATYRRNRRDLVKVNEQPDFTTDETPEVSTSQMTSSRYKVTSSDSGVETQPSTSEQMLLQIQCSTVLLGGLDEQPENQHIFRIIMQSD